MIDRAPGPHITFVDPRFHGNANRILRNAIRLIDMFEESGVNRESIVVTVSVNTSSAGSVILTRT